MISDELSDFFEKLPLHYDIISMMKNICEKYGKINKDLKNENQILYDKTRCNKKIHK